ncbi:MAG: hypothetical protein IK099_07740 [Clostridia bacterium]|nr:hypothetical protein [Clostridia bacterium]
MEVENPFLQEMDASNENGILIPFSFAGCRKYFFDSLKRAGLAKAPPVGFWLFDLRTVLPAHEKQPPNRSFSSRKVFFENQILKHF